MAKPTILLVHGMGTHPLDNMSREFKSGLVIAAKGFGVEDFDIDAKMTIVEYNYSEELDAIRKKLADDANEVLKEFPEGHPSIALVKKLLGFQADFNEDEMLYTHWLDVALYCLFYGNKIQVELAKKMNNLLKDIGVGRLHIVAHSLGTAVVHDTIDKFYKTPAAGESAGDYPYLRSGMHNLKTLWTVANVSNLLRVLNDYTEEGESKVKSGPTGCTDAHYNVYHKLDPFCWLYPFNEDTVQMESGRHFETDIVRKKNTHSFQEYVMAPEVAKYMLTEFAGVAEPLIEDNFTAYVESHKAGAPQGVAERIENSVRDLKAGASADRITNLKELIETLKAFKDAVETVWDEE